jgi:hypothetical protein
MIAVLVLLGAPRLAGAETSRAWAAAKDNLPADTAIVMNVNIAALAKSQIVSQMLPMMLGADEDAKKTLDIFKSECKLDPFTAMQSVLVGTDAAQQHGVAYIALAGIDRPKLTACMSSIAKVMAKKPVTIKSDGNISEIALDKGTVYVGWIGNDVLVVPLKDNDKASLASWMGGKGSFARSTAAGPVAKLNTSAAIWGATTVTKQLPDATMKVGYGSISYANGNLSADVHAQLDNPKQAAAMATQVNGQIAQFKGDKSIPQGITDAIKTVKVTSVADEVAVKASIAEKDLAQLLMMLLRS